MTVAHSNITDNPTGTAVNTSSGANAHSFAHVSAGAEWALVFVAHLTTAPAANITGVRWGGVALTKNGVTAQDAGGEAKAIEIWFKDDFTGRVGDTVQVDKAAADGSWCLIITGTADDTTSLVGRVDTTGDGTLATVNVDDGSPGTSSERYCGVSSALAAVPAVAANNTALQNIDAGQNVAAVCMRTVEGQGALATGFSSGTIDDRAMIHVAVKESPGPITRVGGFAVELDLGLAGTIIQPQVVAGGTAVELDLGLAGTRLQPFFITGGTAVEQDVALTGSIIQDSGPSGITVVGGTAIELDAALPGTVLMPFIITGGTAVEENAALAGTVQQMILVTGGTAVELDAALAGTVTVEGSLEARMVDGFMREVAAQWDALGIGPLVVVTEANAEAPLSFQEGYLRDARGYLVITMAAGPGTSFQAGFLRTVSA